MYCDIDVDHVIVLYALLPAIFCILFILRHAFICLPFTLSIYIEHKPKQIYSSTIPYITIPYLPHSEYRKYRISRTPYTVNTFLHLPPHKHTLHIIYRIFCTYILYAVNCTSCWYTYCIYEYILQSNLKPKKLQLLELQPFQNSPPLSLCLLLPKFPLYLYFTFAQVPPPSLA